MAVHEIETLASNSARSLAYLLVFVMVLTLPRLVSAQAVVPLPADLVVEAPGPDVPPEMAKFSGVWGNGAWDGVLAHVLVVEQVRPDGQARVVYAYGDAAVWNVRRGYTRVNGRVEGGVLTFDFRGGRVRVQYRFQDESLKGTYTINGRVSTVVLERTTVADVARTPTPPSSPPKESDISNIDGTWRAAVISDTGRRWSSTIRISSSKFDGTISCEPFPEIRVSGDVGENRAMRFLVNEGRREIPAMGEYIVSGKFPSLEIRHYGGRCGSAVLQFAR